MEEKKCKICGSTKDMNPEMFNKNCPQYVLMKNEKICYSCAFWKNHANYYGPNVFIYEADGKLHRTTTSNLFVNRYTNIGFLGMGGNSLYIQMLETGETFETNNLWYQGEIPEHFKDEKGLQENCRLLSREEYIKILQEQGKGKIVFCEVNEHIGQASIEEALKEINRMNKQETEKEQVNPLTVWRMDFSEYLYCTDETDENVFNPCKLKEGYCWIVSVPQYCVYTKKDKIPVYKGDRNLLYENLYKIQKQLLEKVDKTTYLKNQLQELIIEKNQSEYDEITHNIFEHLI